MVSPDKCIIAVICPGQEDNISDLTYDSVICQLFTKYHCGILKLFSDFIIHGLIHKICALNCLQNSSFSYLEFELQIFCFIANFNFVFIERMDIPCIRSNVLCHVRGCFGSVPQTSIMKHLEHSFASTAPQYP